MVDFLLVVFLRTEEVEEERERERTGTIEKYVSCESLTIVPGSSTITTLEKSRRERRYEDQTYQTSTTIDQNLVVALFCYH